MDYPPSTLMRAGRWHPKEGSQAGRGEPADRAGDRETVGGRGPAGPRLHPHERGDVVLYPDAEPAPDHGAEPVRRGDPGDSTKRDARAMDRAAGEGDRTGPAADRIRLVGHPAPGGDGLLAARGPSCGSGNGGRRERGTARAAETSKPSSGRPGPATQSRDGCGSTPGPAAGRRGCCCSTRGTLASTSRSPRGATSRPRSPRTSRHGGRRGKRVTRRGTGTTVEGGRASPRWRRTWRAKACTTPNGAG